MVRLLIPIVLAVIGAAAGVGAGLYLRPAPTEEAAMEEDRGETTTDAEGQTADAAQGEAGHAAAPCPPSAEADAHATDDHGAGGEDDGEGEPSFVKLNNQFIVPVLEEGRIVSMVVLSLSLETGPGGSDIVFQREPKLRDSFLQVLFDHSNSGGFSGAFTGGDRLQDLRTALRAAARRALGSTVKDVLVTDIARQDL